MAHLKKCKFRTDALVGRPSVCYDGIRKIRKERCVPLHFEQFLELFAQYGLWFVAGVCYCEYLNLPGFPAGIIMPALGVLAHQSELNLLIALLISVVAGTLASLTVYALARWGGKPIIHRLFGKSERFRSAVVRAEAWIDRRGGWALFLSRLIPVMRTIVSIPAGLLGIPVARYTFWSALGVAAWNTVFIVAGYCGSHVFLAAWA